jgi:cell division protein FtsQ
VRPAGAKGSRMGSSRASTPAGRRRAARRTAAAKAPARRAAPKRPAKRTAPKARKPSKPRKAPPKPKARRKPRSRRPAGGQSSRWPKVLGVGAVVVAVLAAGYMLWFRNSSFVAVEDVSISGMSGPEREPVEAALAEAAAEMTTLNLDEASLAASVAGFPTVIGVEADADFPHGLTVTVEDRPPVVLAAAGNQVVPVGGDGTLLAGVDAGDEKLPTIEVGELPAQGALTGEGLEIARVMGAAPKSLRDLVESVSYEGPEGVEVMLEGEIPVYFGPGDHAAEKWTAAAAVLASPEIDTLTYVDVRVPERPALGGAAPAVSDSTTEATVPETGPTVP